MKNNLEENTIFSIDIGDKKHAICVLSRGGEVAARMGMTSAGFCHGFKAEASSSAI